MNRQAIALGRIFGIPIGLDYSWFIVFALRGTSAAVLLNPCTQAFRWND